MPPIHQWNMHPIFGDHRTREWTEHDRQLKRSAQSLCGERERQEEGLAVAAATCRFYL